MPGLGASFGRGAATTFQQDLANSDCILFMGSNMAEAHPVGFRWPMRAKEKGATLIHVDPRFSRTSALCDVFVPIRAGSDIAFLGALVNYVLTHDKWFREYVLAYTNATAVITDAYIDAEQDHTGIFSGYDPASRTYPPETSHWEYAGQPAPPPTQTPRHIGAMSWSHAVATTTSAAPRLCPVTIRSSVPDFFASARR